MAKARVFLLALTLTVAQPGNAAAGKLFTTYGDIVSYVLPLAALAATIIHCDGEGLGELTTGMLLTNAATQGLKRTVGRTRPDGSDTLSFPSGHATRSFAAAAFLDRRYGLGAPAYFLAWTVGASRVDAEAHYWSDVVGAAVITTLIVFAVTGEDD